VDVRIVVLARVVSEGTNTSVSVVRDAPERTVPTRQVRLETGAPPAS
jgi:hypothetical protein